MGSEYVRLSIDEQVYGQKMLLQTQLDTLDLLNRIKNFRKLRKQELLLRVKLKNKISEAIKSLDEFESYLPKSAYKIEKPEERKKKVVEEEKKETLQDEMKTIRDKLARLQQGF